MYDDPRLEMLVYLPEGVASVLDVGCSTGAFGREISGRADVRLVGIEPSESSAAAARETYDTVITGLFPDAVDQLDPDERFDVIFLNDVLEHLVDPGQALEACHALLAPEGRIVASIPNVRHLSVTGPLVVRGEFAYKDVGILDATHLRFFTPKTMVRLFAGSGWQVDHIEPINLGLRAGGGKTPRWIDALGRVTRRRTDAFFAPQYAVVARRQAPDRG